MTFQSISVRIPNQSGLRLATEIYKPDADGKLPVVFLFHGFTGYKENPALVDLARRVAEIGFVSVRFTASGFGDSEGTLEKDYLFSNYLRDAHAMYEYVSKLPYVDSSRMGIYGHSMGGKLAVFFARDHAVQAMSVVSAPVTFQRTSYGPLLYNWEKRGYLEKVSSRDGKTIRVPYSYVSDVEQYDVLKAAGLAQQPHALVIAGTGDTEVPWDETKKIYDALTCPKDWLLLDGIPHKYSQNPALIHTVNQPIATFFNNIL